MSAKTPSTMCSASARNEGAGRRRIAALLASIAIATGCARVANAAPYRPAADDEVIERLPRLPAAPIVQSASGAPRLEQALAYASEHVATARRLGDPRYLGHAQTALAPWWGDPDAPIPVAMLRAQIHQHGHRFDEALADLERVLARDARYAPAYLMRAAIELVRGEYAAAERSCRSLIWLAPTLTGAECLLRVRSFRGEAQVAYRQLAMLGSRLADSADAETIGEIELTLAQISERLGALEAARAHYQRALATREPDTYAVASYADYLLDRGEWGAVLALAERHPEFADLPVRAALARRRAAPKAPNPWAERVRAQFVAHRARGDFAPTRDYARFLLDIEGDARAALDAALENWRTQREPADARIVLRASLAASRPAAADDVIAFVRERGVEDVRLAALIAAAEESSS